MKNKNGLIKPTRGLIYLNEGETLTDIIKRLTDAGVTDFTKVRYDHDYVGCSADHGDGYCYCPSSYADSRLEWEI